RLHALYWEQIPISLDWLRPWRVQSGWVGLGLIIGIQGPRRLKEVGRLELLPEGFGPRPHPGCSPLPPSDARRPRPLTLPHRDTHIGNTYLLPDGQMGFVDLQVTCRGNWSRDIGYFMISALEVEERRTREEELLRLYIDRLQEGGVEVPAWGEMW